MRTSDFKIRDENSSNDFSAVCLVGDQPEGKENDRKEPDRKISGFVEESTDAEILDEEREIR